jgi:undecaprenyl-diphosphatase
MSRALACITVLLLLVPLDVRSGGGPLGIDHKVEKSDTGIWNRNNQNLLQYGAVAVDLGIALWEGGDSRLGHTAWQSIDSTVLSVAAATVLKPTFGRLRPSETDDPDQWRKGGRSFPSGEVASITGVVTPYVLAYGHDTPAVWALELLPLYDGIARIKSQGHWQTDVLAAFGIGTASGYLAIQRDSPFFLSILPKGVSVDLKTSF